jgi:hypothetical protein
MAEVQHRRRLRNRRYRQVDPSKAAQGLAIVERVFQCLVGQPVPLLQKVEPQHPFQPDRRPAALAFWVKRPQPLHQPRPGNHLLHLGQKFVPPRLLFLAGVLRLRKAALPLHRPPPSVPPDRQILPDASARRRIFQCFPKGVDRGIQWSYGLRVCASHSTVYRPRAQPRAQAPSRAKRITPRRRPMAPNAAPGSLKAPRMSPRGDHQGNAGTGRQCTTDHLSLMDHLMSQPRGTSLNPHPFRRSRTAIPIEAGR